MTILRNQEMHMAAIGKWRCLAAVALLGSAVIGPAFAQEVEKKGPTDVEAEEMEIIDAENRTIFRGKVVAKRDKTTINTDELTVISVEEKQPDGSMKKLVDVMHAKGHVKIVTENETITSDRADIYDREDRLEAFDNVTLVQSNNTLKGQKLSVNLNTKRTVMTGGRVKGSFLPN
jgi:lipopolysaccharide export system protein LptA